MSDTHQALIYRIEEVHAHPNADKLEITDIAGWQMVIGKGQFKSGDLVVFIQPDSVVPQTGPFEFIWHDHIGLDGIVPESRRRIKPKRLRGQWSEGLLMPVSDFPGLVQKELGEGTDVAELIGVTRYVGDFDKPENLDVTAMPKRKYPRTLRGWFWWAIYKLGVRGRASANLALDVAFSFPIYDVNALKNAGRRGFQEGDTVQVTEKIHGQNARYVVVNDVFYAGSHEQWKRKGDNPWWRVVERYPQIEEFCFQNPGVVLYGEIGPCQKGYDYGYSSDDPFFFAFDAYIPTDHELYTGKNWEWAGNMGFSPTVPVLYVGPYSKDMVMSMVDGDTTLPRFGFEKKQKREGIVVRQLSTGQKLKVVSNQFLEKN